MRQTMVLLLAGLVLAGCGSSTAVPPEAATCTYKDPAHYFALTVPADWKQAGETGDQRIAFNLLDPAGRVATVDVMALPVGETDTNKYLELVRKLFQGYAGFKEQAASVTKHASGHEACLIEGEYVPAPGAAPVHVKRYGLIEGRRQIVITATLPAAAVGTLMPQANQILDSLVVW